MSNHSKDTLPAISPNALAVLERRYLIKDAEGRPTETVPGMFARVAQAVAQADTGYPDGDVAATADRFYKLMTSLDFLPNSPTLMNAGRELGQLSACFVLPVEDSMEAIFEAIKQAALIHKSGGGTGFSFSRLRPSGSSVHSTGGVASGPISFMKVFNIATEAVKQGGTRRGANMGILRVDHPDILDFIDCKQNPGEITNFNISVGITEAFMQAVEQGGTYSLVHPATKELVGELSAREVFARIVSRAWQNGEPGIIFLDRLNRDNAVPSQGEIESTNPCGEQPLLPYESCNLGSINLVNMLRPTQGGGWEIDYARLEYTVRTAIHFLDNVIDVNIYPLELIETTTKQTRKVGLGVMGYADMLLKLGLGYNTPEAVTLAEALMKFIGDTAHSASQQLAVVRGAFPLFEQSIFAGGTPIRNATCTTIAPTGTLSIIANCSSGVEPVFAYVYIRSILDGTEMLEVSPILKAELEQRGLYSEELMHRIAQEGSLAHVTELPAELRELFVSSHDITPEYHLRTQAAFQKHTDNAVSKTVNFSSTATEQDVYDAFMLSYKLGCKGVTIYRDGSREGQVLSIGGAGSKAQQPDAPLTGLLPRPRSPITMGVTERMHIGCGNLYVTVNYDEHGICEVFTSTGKAGGCPSQSESTARLISIALRSGVAMEEILTQLRGIRCPSTVRQQGMQCTSCPDAIGRVIKRVDDMLKGGSLSRAVPPQPCDVVACPAGPQPDRRGSFCPECGAALEHEGGCVICRSCGYSKCN